MPTKKENKQKKRRFAKIEAKPKSPFNFRSSEEVLNQFPLNLTLCGGKKFKVPVPMAGAMLGWSEDFGAVMAGFMKMGAMDKSDFDAEQLVEVLESPKLMADLFFRFCGPALNRKKVLAESSIVEFNDACKEVSKIALPLSLSPIMNLRSLTS